MENQRRIEGAGVDQRSILREINDRVASLAWVDEQDKMAFICECGDPLCVEQVELTITHYASLREHDKVFKPGHR